MSIPEAFRESRREVLHSLIRQHSFGTLVSFDGGELAATHLPFWLDAGQGPDGTLMGHMARANPHWQSFRDGEEVLILFQGPHAYIPYDIITFDCYGTLIDWETGISAAFIEAARADGIELDCEEVLRAYAGLEPLVEAEAYRSYREVLSETARRVAAQLGWCLSDKQATFLADSLPRWQPFADTNPALERLAAAGYGLGILSNVDDDLLAGTLRHFPVEFELLVTAQQVGSYKPAPGHLIAARGRVGGRRWLHAAQSYFHDVASARALGVPTAWINRTGEAAPDGGRPTRELRTLTGLADWLAQAKPRGDL